MILCLNRFCFPVRAHLLILFLLQRALFTGLTSSSPGHTEVSGFTLSSTVVEKEPVGDSELSPVVDARGSLTKKHPGSTVIC